jgi:hypothetical protein
LICANRLTPRIDVRKRITDFRLAP